MFSGNMMWSNLATGLVIFAVIGFTLLPIWPDVAKKILWYLSVTFLIFTLSFCLIRFFLFLLLWITGYDFWIFPRLFDESLSFQDSFKPIYSFEKGSSNQGYYRLGMLLLIGAGGYWAYSQPSEFDGFIQAQKDFIDDLYTGKLLADVAFDPKEHMKGGKKVPSLEDLLKELENDEKSITEKATEVEEGGEVPSEFIPIETDAEVDFSGNSFQDREEQDEHETDHEETIADIDE
jgi:translocation protein SEC62